MSDDNTKNLMKALDFAFGTYTGTGISHDGQPFAGTFVLEPILAGRGFQIRYLATSQDGSLLHAEHSLIAPDESGLLCLWNFNSNSSGLLPHRLEALRTEPSLGARFVYGDTEDITTFRERITLTIDPDGTLGYVYAWGLPGESFAERSGLRMKRS